MVETAQVSGLDELEGTVLRTGSREPSLAGNRDGVVGSGLRHGELADRRPEQPPRSHAAECRSHHLFLENGPKLSNFAVNVSKNVQENL